MAWTKRSSPPVVETPPALIEVADADYVDPTTRKLVRRKISESRGIRKYEITADEALISYPIPAETRRKLVELRNTFRWGRATRTPVCQTHSRVDAGVVALLRQLSALGVNQSLFIEAALVEKFEREGILIPPHRSEKSGEFV